MLSIILVGITPKLVVYIPHAFKIGVLFLLYQLFTNLLKQLKMKSTKITYWITTSLIFLMEGVMPALFFHSEASKQGIGHLQYPMYFGDALAVFKVLGALALILPMVPARIKEWAYAGFAFNFLFASISHFAIDGMDFQSFFPLIFLVILIISYRCYYKLKANIPVSDLNAVVQ
jgi:hypothetical protein